MEARRGTDGRVAIIGAGPHGLAAAAYLRAQGTDPLVFGDPMAFWRDNMPKGMVLRSALRASNIAEPERAVNLDRWSAETGRPLSFPLPLEDFRAYAAWYQQQLVPDVDRRMVAEVSRNNGSFALRLADGAELEVDKVAVAAGLAPFPRIPAQFRDLPPTLVSHTSAHTDLDAFRGRRVAVLGGGQSALENAALLHEAGVDVEVFFRAGGIVWLTGPGTSTRRLKWRSAPTDICGPRSSWLTAAPDLYRNLPGPVRRAAAGCAGPAGGHWLRERMEGIPLHPNTTITRSEPADGGLELTLSDGSTRVVDHLMLGTGYEIDVRAYPFLDRELAASIETVGGLPVLGPGLESSVAGLHFLGAPATYTFGPVMRFVTGTWYTAPAFATRLRGRRQPPLRWSF